MRKVKYLNKLKKRSALLQLHNFSRTRLRIVAARRNFDTDQFNETQWKRYLFVITKVEMDFLAGMMFDLDTRTKRKKRSDRNLMSAAEMDHVSKGILRMNARCLLCPSNSRKNSILARFPLKKNLRKVWLEQCNLDPGKNVINKYLCRNHFKDADFKVSKKGHRFLRPNAFPTVFFNKHGVRKVKERESSKLEVPENYDKFDFNNLEEVTSKFVINVLQYIGGYVVLKLLKIKNIASCENCVQLLRSDPVESTFIQMKDQGRLVYPSKEVFNICVAAEQIFRANNEKVLSDGFVKCAVYEIMQRSKNYFANDLHSVQHRKQLIKLICEHFLKVRLAYKKSHLADSKEVLDSKSDSDRMSDSNWMTDSDSDA